MAVPGKRRGPSLEDLLDRAIAIPSGAARAQVARLRRQHPAATPTDIVRMLEQRYLKTVMSTGGAVGAAAAVPAVGTGTALALTTGQAGTFLAASAQLALAVAEVHGVEVEDVPRRRTLVLASLLGEQGSVVVEEELSIGTIFWARTLLTRLPLTTVKAVNRTLRRRFARYTATKGAALFFGRMVPFGVGAVIGATGARAMGKTMVKGVERAFGPPPPAFVVPAVVEGATSPAAVAAPRVLPR